MDKYVRDLMKRYPILDINNNEIVKAFDIIKKSFESGGKL